MKGEFKVDKKIFYTTGELADMAGISYKSIRVYIEKRLLVPDKITEAGYKLFSPLSVERLQKILMFKYLDFSLEEIGNMLEKENFQESLSRQKEYIELKLTHLNQIKNAADVSRLSELDSMKFQRIMANHMLYHIGETERKILFAAADDMLTDEGKFIASTIGNNHMKDIFELAGEYNKNIKAPGWFSRGFNLENGKEQLEKYFTDVKMFVHDNNLMVPEKQGIGKQTFFSLLCSAVMLKYRGLIQRNGWHTATDL